jgi:transposase
VREHQDNDGQAFRGNGKLTPEQDEIKKLKARVKRLEMERDILKKRRHSLQQKRSEIRVYHPT